MKRLLSLLLTVMCAAIGSRTAAAVADTTVSIVNIYPGSEIYELEGHTMLRLRMPDADLLISYGTYDFSQPNFAYRFVKGETDYWVSALSTRPVLNSYKEQGRRITDNVLNLNPAQKQRLLDLLYVNLLPENRTYRYNYVRDNCATRPLRMVELAAGDTIMFARPPLEGNQSFRSVMRHFHRNYPWYQFGIDLALGSGIDRTIDLREFTFAPALLDMMLPDATVGTHDRLVGATEVINDTAPDAAVLAPTPWWLSPKAVCWAVMLLTVIVTVCDLRRGKVSRWFDAVLFAMFGLAGCLLAFLVFISVHEATSPNILLLWLNPLCFIPVVFIWINRCKRLVLSYQIANFVAIMVLIVLAIIQEQSLNAAFYPLMAADAMRALNYIYLTVNISKCHP